MSVIWEAARKQAADDKAYPLATVLHPQPNRSIRGNQQEIYRQAGIIALAAAFLASLGFAILNCL